VYADKNGFFNPERTCVAMIIIIDGYNVLKQLTPTKHISEKARAHFITELAAYGKRTKNSIVLVFDGGPDQWPREERMGAVRTIYAGTRLSADEYIQNFIEAHAKKELLLVSSDHDLADWASEYEVVSIAAYDFYGLMKEKLRSVRALQPVRGGSAAKSDSATRHEELDALMTDIDEIPVKQDDVRHGVVNEYTGKLTKQERLLLKKLKKL
jgi:predicted RNA-binding protein with PIN domain